jgi:hypothetical protein
VDSFPVAKGRRCGADSCPDKRATGRRTWTCSPSPCACAPSTRARANGVVRSCSGRALRESEMCKRRNVRVMVVDGAACSLTITEGGHR